MIYSGTIKNGVAVLNPPASLPDGTSVRIEVEPIHSDFWENKTVDELAREQGVQPIKNLSDFRIDWPEDESIDDLMALVREVRR